MTAAPPLDLVYLRSRFWERVNMLGEGECWPWTLSVGGHGYGQTWDGITVRYAHRCAWELTNGRIPDGLTVDHTCHNRICCNPRHLRLLTREENASRPARPCRETCQRGHPWTDQNTYYRKDGRRSCRACRSLSEQRR